MQVYIVGYDTDDGIQLFVFSDREKARAHVIAETQRALRDNIEIVTAAALPTWAERYSALLTALRQADGEEAVEICSEAWEALDPDTYFWIEEQAVR